MAISGESTSVTALTWRLQQVEGQLDMADATTTVGEVLEQKGLPPLTSDDPVIRQTLLSSIIRLLRPQLDDNSLDLASIDLDPNRRATKAGYNFRQLLEALHNRQNELNKRLGLSSLEQLTETRADEIAAVAAKEGVSQDEFRGAAEQAYLEFLRFGRLEQAEALQRLFSKDSGRGVATFDVNQIPAYEVREVTICCKDRAKDLLSSYEHIALGVAYAQKLGMPQTEIDMRIRSTIMLAAAYSDGDLPAALRPYVGTVISQEEIDAAKMDRAKQLLADLREADIGRLDGLERMLATLRDKGITQAETNDALRTGYRVVLAEHGLLDELSQQYEKHLGKATIPDAEKAEALGRYCDQLVCCMRANSAWLTNLTTHRQFFKEGRYEAAVLNGAYCAINGSGWSPAIAAKLRRDNPEVDWSKLIRLEPESSYKGVDMRAATASKLANDNQRILARILFDWTGPSIDTAWSINTDLRRLHEATVRAAGLAQEKDNPLVQQLMKTTDRQLVQEGPATFESLAKREDDGDQGDLIYAVMVLRAFGGRLDEAPYTDLLAVRQAVAAVMRETHGQEIYDHTA